MRRVVEVVVAIAGLVTVLGVSGPVKAQVSFTHLTPAVPNQPSFAHGISADGSTVVGQSGYHTPFATNEQPVSWSLAPQILPDLREPDPFGPRGSVFAASADGSVLVGEGLNPFSVQFQGIKWTNGVAAPLPPAPGVPFDGTIGRAVSANGQITVGFSYQDSSGYRAHRWNGTTPTVIAGAPGYSFSEATGVSADGVIVAGFSFANPTAGSYGVGWTSVNGQTTLLQTPAGGAGVWISGIAGDGSTVFGQVNMGSLAEGNEWVAAIWRDGVPTLLPLPSGPYPEAFAMAASFDGSEVVGRLSGGPLGPETAFLWDATHGMRNISDILEAGGVNLAGLNLYEANGISADGHTIAGTARDANGAWSTWVAVVPSPGTIVLVLIVPMFVRTKRPILQISPGP